MTVQLFLTVNEEPVQTDYFVAGYIDHVISGIVESLENTGPIKDLNLSIKNNKVILDLNGSELPLNEFVNKIIIGTLIGMISTLKGVNTIEKLNILLHK